jgi:hypothetical protein
LSQPPNPLAWSTKSKTSIHGKKFAENTFNASLVDNGFKVNTLRKTRPRSFKLDAAAPAFFEGFFASHAAERCQTLFSHARPIALS